MRLHSKWCSSFSLIYQTGNQYNYILIKGVYAIPFVSGTCLGAVTNSGS